MSKGAKTVKAKGGLMDKVKYFISGGPGKAAGAKAADKLINMHKKKK